MIEEEHYITSTEHLDTKIVVNCFCGATWSEPANTTGMQMLETMKAHRKYFNKPVTVTL